jgi:hypothetical protein
LIKTTGAKKRFTVVLAMMSDGFKLPMMIIFKNLATIPQKIKRKFAKDAILACNSTGWMVEQLMIQWIKRIWDNVIISDKEKKFLIMDKFSVHQKETVLNLLKEIDSEVEFIPPGCTGILQPLDTDINKPFKNKMRAKFESWFATAGSTKSNFTKSGSIRPPSLELVTEWCVQSWKDINIEAIKNSFKHCGIISFLL